MEQEAERDAISRAIRAELGYIERSQERLRWMWSMQTKHTFTGAIYVDPVNQIFQYNSQEEARAASLLFAKLHGVSIVKKEPHINPGDDTGYTVYKVAGVGFRGGGLPPSCRLEYSQVEVPAHTETVAKVVCGPEDSEYTQ